MHRFEIFTLVSEIHENVDLVLGIKNIFELEAVIDLCGLLFQFPQQIHLFFFQKRRLKILPKVQKVVVIEAPFVEK